MSQIKLTNRQEKFAQLLFEGNTQIDAFKQAYDSSNYGSDNALYVKASEVANNVKIQLRLEELRNPVQARLKAHAKKFADRIIEAADATGPKDRPDHQTRLKAAETGLDYAGYAPVQKNMNVNVDMSKEDVEKLLGNI